MTRKRNVFVIGLNDFNRFHLERIRGAERYNFIGFLNADDLEEPQEYRVEPLLKEAEAQLRAFDGPIDAIVGYIDMPASFMTPILCKQFGVPTPSLESVLLCQHKYWSRLEQRKVIPDHVPRFDLVNPFSDDPLAAIDLDYPFWLKPVKSAGSYLGFRIRSPREFLHKLEIIRANILHLAEPFNYVLAQAELPPEVRDIDFSYCIAEQITPGRQCTLEGFVVDGKVEIYGVVDSIRHGNLTSFARYQYPSRLPPRVRRRMIDIAQRVVAHMGLDHTGFNIEFFWQERGDHIWLLEINTRVSQSHSYIFEQVDGSSNHQVMVEAGLGLRPDFPHREGPYRCAAKFFLRKFEDATVVAVPSPERVAEVERAVPGSRIRINVSEGMALRHLLGQDSYSYDIAWIMVAGNNTRELFSKYERCVEMLGFRFADADAG